MGALGTQIHRMLRRDAVKFGGGWKALVCPAFLRPALPDDPRPRRQFSGALRHTRQCDFTRWHFEQIDFSQGERRPHPVDVRVDQAGDHCPAVGIFADGIGITQVDQLFVAADGDNPFAGDGKGFGAGLCVVQRDDVRVADDAVDHGCPSTNSQMSI